LVTHHSAHLKQTARQGGMNAESLVKTARLR
jgi:hypothetical protein